jgi:hypothetical protein
MMKHTARNIAPILCVGMDVNGCNEITFIVHWCRLGRLRKIETRTGNLIWRRGAEVYTAKEINVGGECSVPGKKQQRPGAPNYVSYDYTAVKHYTELAHWLNLYDVPNLNNPNVQLGRTTGSANIQGVGIYASHANSARDR